MTGVAETGAEPGPGPFAFTARTRIVYAVPLVSAFPLESKVIAALVVDAPLPGT